MVIQATTWDSKLQLSGSLIYRHLFGYQVNDHLSIGASVGMSYNAIALKTDLRFPNEMIGVLRMVDDVVCAPFKDNNDMITDLLLLGICNAKEGMNPFNKMGALQVL